MNKYKKFAEVLKTAPTFIKDPKTITSNYLREFNDNCFPNNVAEKNEIPDLDKYDGEKDSNNDDSFNYSSQEESEEQSMDGEIDDINNHQIANEKEKFKEKIDFNNLSHKYENENDLKMNLNKICFEQGFKIIKNSGKQNDKYLNYLCEFGGRKRETVSEGKRKRNTKKLGIGNLKKPIKLFYVRLPF